MQTQATIKTGAEGTDALPPEPPTMQPAVQADPVPATADLQKAAAKRMKQAEQKIARQIMELVVVGSKDYFLRLCITLEFIWLKIANQGEYVDKLFADLKAKHGDKLPLSQSTLQHYEGPMLHWLAELAREKNPADPNLRDKFSPTFLREHLEYIFGKGEAELKSLQEDCPTLTKLDEKYGNGRVNPQVPGSQPMASTMALAERPSTARTVTMTAHSRSAANTKSRKTTGCRSHGQQHRPAQSAQDELDHPTNDQLLEKLYALEKDLDRMKEDGVRIDADVSKKLLQLVVKTKAINAYFRQPTS